MPVYNDTLELTVCNSELPYLWNGQNIAGAGVYTDSLTSIITGCDSVSTLNLNVLPVYGDTLDLTVCESELPYLWNGQNIAGAGVYTDSLTSIITGCDSVSTLNLNVLPVYSDTLDLTVCESELPYFWNGQNIAGAGVYTDSLTSIITGCDSVSTLNLNVLPVYIDTLELTVCNAELPYLWNGQDIAGAGIYTNSQISVVTGCDSTLVLNLNVVPEFRDTTEMFVCESELPYFWNGNEVSSNGIYSDTVQSIAGCDSILTLLLEVLPVSNDTLEMTVCKSEIPFNWNGRDIDAGGSYTDTLTSFVTGCDSILTLNLDVLPVFADTTNLTVCESELPYFWSGMNIASSGIHVDTLISVITGCDSVSMLNLNVMPVSDETVEMTICSSELPYTWNGIDVTSAGIYNTTLNTAAGCDSLLTLNVSVEPVISDTLKLTVCETELPFTWKGQQFTQADTVTLNVPSMSSDCDTLRILELSVEPEILVSLSISPDKQVVTEGELVQFTAIPVNPGSAPVYAWFVNGVEMAGKTSRTFSYTPQDGDEVYATLLSNLRCTSGIPAESNTVVITVNEPPPGEMVVVPEVLPVDCYGNNTGTVKLTVSEGVPPYTYLWNNGETSKNIYGVTAGAYTVTVTDAENNTKQLSVEVKQPEELVVSYTKVDVGYSTNPVGSIDLSVYGGSGAYTYSWTGPDGFTSDEEDIEQLAAGAYTVWVTDTSNCNAAVSVVIEASDPETVMNCPPAIELNCKNLPPAYSSLSEYEGAGGEISAVFDADVSTFRLINETSDRNNCPETVTRVYEIQDVHGNAVKCEQLIIINDVIAPYLKITDKRVACYDDVPPVYKNVSMFLQNGGQATDDCKINPASFKFISESTDDQTCPETIIRIYEISDMCGNRKQTNEKIVVHDEIAPEIVQVPVVDKNTCSLPAPYETVADFIDAGGIVTDNCNNIEITFISDSIIGDNCPKVVKRNYEFSDGCFNTTVYQETITIDDTSAPVVTCPAPETLNGTLADLGNFTGLKYSDTLQNIFLTDTTAIDLSVSENCTLSSITYIDKVSGTCPVLVERTFTVTDLCNNQTSCTQEISIFDSYTPEFDSISPLCRNSVPPALPTISNNGITGTWQPETIETGQVGIFEFTFVPDPGQCAVKTSVWVEITDIVVPQFENIGPLCLGSIPPVLPATSLNGISGKWQPAVVNTSTKAVSTYTFTPDAGQCAPEVSLEIEVSDEIIPEFSLIGPLCINEIPPQLPAISENNIRGTWNPATIQTSIPDTVIYTFTPDNGTCAIEVTMKIEVRDEIVPEFMPLGPFCRNAEAPELPAVSENGISGTWNPAVIKTNGLGTTVYTFTPDDDRNCVIPAIMEIEVVKALDNDTIMPVASCRNITVQLDESGVAFIQPEMIDDNSYDNCAIDTMYLSKNEFNCADLGVNLVDLIVVDYAGNEDICTAEVTVTDKIAPEVACADITIQLDQNARYTLKFGEISAGYSDNCGIESVALDKYEFTCDDIGTVPVKMTVIDYSGNSSSCTAEVTIHGNIAPVALNDTAYTLINTPVQVDVAQNDYDIKTSVISATVTTVLNPKNGTADVDPVSGVITYVPKEGFRGTDVLVYSICDDGIPCEPMCEKATLVIHVLEPNIKPVAINDYFTIMCFTLNGESLLQNDYDVDSQNIYIDDHPVRKPAVGSLVIHPDGTFTYEPAEYYSGTDSFMYRIFDRGLPSYYDTATVYITYLSDFDCDGLPDIDDIDDDNDGILDIVEGIQTVDSDDDGIFDNLDIDSDNDGIPDNVEGQGEHNYIPPTGVDTDGDGWDDAYDPDNGGYNFVPVNTDGDAVPDYRDIDSDNDNVLDYIEGHDANADGVPDTYRLFSDSDHDGLDDAYDTFANWNKPSSPDNETGSNAPLQDFDGDGTRDWRDVNDDDDGWPTAEEDTNRDGDYSNDDPDLNGHPEYLDVGTDCELFIPEGFSPNNDGVHDFFQVYCIQNYPEAVMKIFDRSGNLIFQKDHYGNIGFWGSDANAWWWGTITNRRTRGTRYLPAGNYMYVLELGNGETRNGTVMIAY